MTPDPLDQFLLPAAAGETLRQAVSGTAIYLAARYSRRAELCGYPDDLTGRGYRVTSRWLNGSHQLDNDGRPIGDDGERMFEDGSPDVDRYRGKFALDDREDVLASDTLIAFAEEPRASTTRGGRHVELGIALGASKRVIIVGPRENVFCWLPQVDWFDCWPRLLATLPPAAAMSSPGCPLCEAPLNADGSCSRSCAGVGDG